MIAPDLETAIDRLQELVDGARVIVPFTGAGISTECGIPDFRSPGGLWTKNRPIPFDEFLASQEMRNEAWRRRFAMDEHFAAARPGRGHLALASLYRTGKAPARDHAEHRQSASELRHCSGTRDRAARQQRPTRLCLDCAKRYELSWVASSSPMRTDARRIARTAAAPSRPRRSRSGRRCRSGQCAAPSN